MKVIRHIVLLMACAILLIPVGLIAIVLNPFFELFYEEDIDNGNSK